MGTRSGDGGATFDVLRESQPSRKSCDLVFQHAFDLDSSGDPLAFASVTGNLWLSENAGDNESGFGTHLPPTCAREFLL